MKHIALTLTALWAAVSACAQGTVSFATKVTGQVDAPVTYRGAKAGDAFLGQLYAGAKGGTLAAVGQPVPFRSDAGIGYITAGGAVAVPGVAGGAEADVKLVAWARTQGATYDAAKTLNMGGFNESGIITVKTGNSDAVPPTVAANLVGLQGFEITPIIILNELPVAGTDSVGRIKGRPIKVLQSTLLANDSDADGPAALNITAVSALSANGATVHMSGAYVIYEADAGDAYDSFTYTVSDGTDSATGTVIVVVAIEPAGLTLNVVASRSLGNARHFTVAGIPGRRYKLQHAFDLVGPWSNVNGAEARGMAAANGELILQDISPPTETPSVFYRVVEP